MITLVIKGSIKKAMKLVSERGLNIVDTHSLDRWGESVINVSDIMDDKLHKELAVWLAEDEAPFQDGSLLWYNERQGA